MKGSMEGWYEDELECSGHCGLCEACDEAYYAAADDAYDAYVENDL